jgi:transcriptional regulator with XRE-family HTH domain
VQLRRMRKGREAKQFVIARRLGIDPSYLSRIESGKRPCPAELAAKLLALLSESGE